VRTELLYIITKSSEIETVKLGGNLQLEHNKARIVNPLSSMPQLHKYHLNQSYISLYNFS